MEVYTKQEVNALLDNLRAELLGEMSIKNESPEIPDTPKGDRWLTMKEAKELTSRGRGTIDRWRDQGKIVSQRNSSRGKVLYLESSLLRQMRLSH